MKKFYLTAIFITTLLCGIGLSSSVDIRGRIDSFIHRDCERWDEDWQAAQLFTLSEAKELLNKRIVVKNSESGKIRRIVDYQMIKKDKFAVSVYWGKSDNGENIRLINLTKDVFEKHFRVVD